MSRAHAPGHEGRDRLVPITAAIVAVLAALGTLFSHHHSILALSLKNQAVLTQLRSIDLYNTYQAHRTRYTVYSALLAAGVANGTHAAALSKIADREQKSSLQLLANGKHLELEATQEQDRSEIVMQAFETLEMGTTLFEVAIVFISISALARNRTLLYIAFGVTAIGMVFLIAGLLQVH